MRTLTADALTALASDHVVLVRLLKIEFPEVTIALNSSNWHIDVDGTTYLGAAGLGTITPIDDRPGDIPGLKMELLNVDSSYISLALDDSDQVQGSLVTVMTAILNSGYAVVDVVTDWVGYADTMSISEDGEKGSIVLAVESKVVDILRGHTLTYSDADQKTQYAADRAFEYVVDQSDKPVVFPARQWHFK